MAINFNFNKLPWHTQLGAFVDGVQVGFVLKCPPMAGIQMERIWCSPIVPVVHKRHPLAQRGELTLAEVDHYGRVTPESLRAALGDAPDEVALVSVMLANNEVGTINDITALTAVTRQHGIRFHSDAVQAPAWLPVDFAALGVCAMSVSGHKVGGPHGVGAIVIDRECPVEPLVHGGGQERERRQGEDAERSTQVAWNGVHREISS